MAKYTPSRLIDLTDIDPSTLADGQHLYWDATAQKFSFEDPGTGGGAPAQYEAYAQVSQSFTTGIVDVTSLTLTPPAGTYLVTYMISCNATTAAQNFEAWAHKDGTAIDTSYMDCTAPSPNRSIIVGQGRVTITAGQTIGVKVFRGPSGNQINLYRRSLSAVAVA